MGATGALFYAEKISAPRRWAEHLPQWTGSDQLGALCGIFVILATIVFTIRFFIGLKDVANHTDDKSLKNAS